MEEYTQSSGIDNPKQAGLRKYTTVIIIFIGVVLLLVGAFYSGMLVGKNSDKTLTNYPPIKPERNLQDNQQPTQKPISQPSNKTYINRTMQIYPSLDRRYSFYIFPGYEENKCFYGIKDRAGYEHDISKTLGIDGITCFEGRGTIDSSFAGWADDNKFLINEKDGEVKIVDIRKFTSETYQYDANTLEFIGANRTLKYWLFRRKSPASNVSYTLLERNKNAVLTSINFDSNDRGALYDEANDGFLFISRSYTEQSISVKFDFLKMSDLSLRNILTTEPVETSGRGCAAEYLISVPGEIILTPGCLTVSNKYLNPDGNIHIKL